MRSLSSAARRKPVDQHRWPGASSFDRPEALNRSGRAPAILRSYLSNNE